MHHAFRFIASLLSGGTTSALGLLPRLGRVPSSHPGVPDCELRWHTQPLDNFDFSNSKTWRQRYFVHDKHWTPSGPILFYTGNEANVELYVNATGLMWEHAAELNAMLVFAEHRYYGESQPLGAASAANASTLRWLTMEQALADYSRLIYALKAQLQTSHGRSPPVVVRRRPPS
jgi:lysosomal Pro-X carboxypeptidase